MEVSTTKNGHPLTPPYNGPLSPPMKPGSEYGSTTFAELLDEAIPTPPPSFAEIMKSFSKNGNGDVNTLMAILNAKQAEEDRLARTLEIRIHLLQMHAQRLGMVPVASAQSQQPRPPHGLPSPSVYSYAGSGREISPFPQHKRLPSRSRDSSPRVHETAFTDGMAPRDKQHNTRPASIENRQRSSSSASGSSGSGSMVESRSLPSPSALPLPSFKHASSSKLEKYAPGPQLAPISPKSFDRPVVALIETGVGSKRKNSEDDGASSVEDDLVRKKIRRTSSTSDLVTPIDLAERRSSNASDSDREAGWRSRSNSAGTRASNGLEMLLNAATAGRSAE